MIGRITPLVLTYNEASNIGRTLERLRWAGKVIVVDSGSTDGTLDLAAEFPNVEIKIRAFDTHTAQWNFGLDAVATDWVLSLDADYVLPESFPEELKVLQQDGEIAAYFASFRYCVAGKPLRAALYPPRAVLFRKADCRFEQDGHTQRLRIEGKSAELKSKIDHDDRKPLARWVWAQCRYAELEAGKLLAETKNVSIQDRLRKLVVVAPVLVLLYTLFGKFLIFDGWRGLYYAGQRVVAEMILSLYLIEARWRRFFPGRLSK